MIRGLEYLLYEERIQGLKFSVWETLLRGDVIETIKSRIERVHKEKFLLHAKHTRTCIYRNQRSSNKTKGWTKRSTVLLYPMQNELVELKAISLNGFEQIIVIRTINGC